MISYNQTFANSYLLYLALKHASNLTAQSNFYDFQQVSDLVSYLTRSLEMKEIEVNQSRYSQLNYNIDSVQEFDACHLKLDVEDFLQSYSSLQESLQYSKPTTPQETTFQILDTQLQTPLPINTDSNSTINSSVNTTSSEQVKISVKKPNFSKVNQKSTTSILKRTRSVSNEVDQSHLDGNEENLMIVQTKRTKSVKKQPSNSPIRKKRVATPQSMMQFKFNRWTFHTVKQ